MFTTFNSTIARTVVGTFGTAFCAGLCLLAATAPADAAPAATTRSLVVSYADLDLANPAGRATLNHRIYAAARAVCETGSSNADAALDEMRCMSHAVTAAKAKALDTKRTAAL